MKSHPSYELVGVVGHGRLATVYRVRETALKREVAVKELNDEARRDPHLLQRFWEEARFLANIEHDNVVQIYGLDQERGWVIMELAAGGMDTTVARGPLPAGVVRGVLRQVLDGLDCLHSRGRVHGAIKPGNLLVTQQGLVKLSDSSGVAGGPPTDAPAKYLAPEQTDPNFGPPGPAADLYCLGFSALELLTGPRFSSLFPGFDTGSDSEVGWWQLHSNHDAMPAAASVVPGLPADVARVIDRLLHKEVAARYGSAADALKDLTDVPSPPVPLVPSQATLPAGQARPVPPTATREVPVPTVRGPAPAADTGGPDHGVGGTLLPTIFPVLQSPGNPGAPFPSVAPPPPVAPPPGALETVRDTPRYPRWSRRWVNQKLENPWVLYPVCGTIAFLTVLLLADLFLNRNGGAKPQPAAPRLVKITTSPEGASVFIDKDKEPRPKKTNATFELEPGKHRVRLVLKDYLPVDEEIEVPAGDGPVPKPFEFDLKPLPAVVTPTTGPGTGTAKTPISSKSVEPIPTTGTLALDSSPGKATIFVGGENKGETPKKLDLPPGKYVVRLRRARHKDWEETVEVKAGKETSRQATLERLRDPASFALLVGVRNAADGLPVFRHAPSDITELGRTLLAAGYPEGNVTVLAQLPGAPAGTGPTAERILQAVAALVKDRIPGDTLLLALAGPAVVAPGTTRSYFCPAGADLVQPATLVPLDEVFQKLAACPAETKVVLIDGNRVGASAAARPAAAKPEDLAVGGVAVLTATSNGAPGYVSASQRHGVFWDFVLRGIRGSAEGAPHKVTLGELASQVAEGTRKYVAREYKAEQTPKLVPPSAKDSSAVVASPDPALQCLLQGDALLGKADQLKDAESAKKEYEKAAEKFGQAISLRRDLVEAYLGRAEAYYSLANFDGMIDDCTEAARLDPASAGAYDFRGDAHRGKSGKLQGMKLNEIGLAVQDYSKSIELDPDYARCFNTRGTAHGSISQVYWKGEADKAKVEDELAVADYTRAIDLAPKPRAVYFENRARAFARLSKYDRSVDDYTDALRSGEQLDADYSSVLYYGRGSVFLDTKDYPRAVDDLKAAVKLTPADARVYKRLARALDGMGLKGDAQKARDEAARLERRPPK
jgi:serine/threonine protein kinase/tetratricopeptide (TPR) repeat protein